MYANKKVEYLENSIDRYKINYFHDVYIVCIYIISFDKLKNYGVKKIKNLKLGV